MTLESVVTFIMKRSSNSGKLGILLAGMSVLHTPCVYVAIYDFSPEVWSNPYTVGAKASWHSSPYSATHTEPSFPLLATQSPAQ
jgi:hypothetical protein